ncbi:hypothetical protein [Gordonia hydrophobica]|uniref:Uncharacterized protein n=1 Tax=Gordonia hydrophobica TaxID=40516 RepID=A0ABZ2U676_9ACTN|nr:hypothetical protein [Gordonia hydrophobica]MBM7365608.1 hypothetical protein [Gordonia hydrophobica]
MTLVIAGTAGAEPELLARALHDCGWDGETVVVGTAAAARRHAESADVAVIALDSSMPADHEEDVFLDAFAETETPTALVGCGVDAFSCWPRTLAASRARLDPDHRLPVFATAVALVAEPDCASGIPELAAWCSAEPDRNQVPTRAVPAGTEDSESQLEASAVVRADRMAGLRAGIVAARAEAASSTRAALADVHGRIPEVCAADGFADWLTHVLDAVEQRSRGLFLDRLAQVRAAATGGLEGEGAGLHPLDLSGATAAPGGPPRRAAGPEDAVMLLLGASMGFGVGRMVIAPTLAWAGLGIGGTVLSVVAGTLMALWVVSVRRAATERARTERWAVELIGARRAAIEQWIGAHAGATEAHVSREIWNRTRPTRV